MIGFVRVRYRLSYKAAKEYLGVPDDHAPYKPPPTIPVPFLTLNFTIDGEHYKVAIRV